MRELVYKIKRLLCIHKISVYHVEMSTVNNIKIISTYKCTKCGRVIKVEVSDKEEDEDYCKHDICIEFKDIENGKGIRVMNVCEKCKKVLKVRTILD